MNLPTSIYDGPSSAASPSLLRHARSILHSLSTIRLLSEGPLPEDILLPTSQHGYHLANTSDFPEDGNSLPTDTVGEAYSLSSIGLGNTSDHSVPANTSASSTRSLAYLSSPTITTAFALRSPSASNLALLAEGSGLALRNSASMVNLATTSLGSDVSADGLAQRPNTPTNLYRPGTPTNLYRPNTPTGLHRPSTPTSSSTPVPRSRPHSRLSLSGLNVSSFSASSSPRTSPSMVPNLEYFDLDPERIGGSSFTPSFNINSLTPDDDNAKRRSTNRSRIVSLWPPPPVTGFVVIATVAVSLLAVVGLLPISPTNTPAVISHAKISSLVMSPFLVPLRRFTQFFLAITNFFALLLMEMSISEALGWSWKKFARLVGILALIIMGAKQGVGVLFTVSTGFAVPALYFSRALWEASSGLAPYLAAILPFYALPSLWPASYTLRYQPLDSSSSRTVTFRKRYLLLILFLLNAFPKTILWWSLTALAIGGLATLAVHIHIIFFRDREFLSAVTSLEPPRNRWRALFTTFFRALTILFITSIALFFFNIMHTRQRPLSPVQVSTLNATFLILTAPRPGDEDFLTTTIESYLPYLHTTQPAPFRILVYTHFAEGQHKVFDEARIRFLRVAPQFPIEFLRDPEVSDVPLTESRKFDHFHHLERAVKIVQHRGLRGGWLGILEDDFRLCDDGWDRLMNVLWITKERWIGMKEIENGKEEHEVDDGRGCGAAFVATGGNGLFAPPNLLSAIEHHLYNKTNTAPDLTVQNCLLGLLPGCEQCKGRLVVSERLVMGHMGYNASTGHRGYRREQWQCGWRHPFNNGLSDIVVV